ncbi:YqaA family protein [Prevotella koreensis]|uniref:DedA family protein n=1 Tax=Prevotella koreensis TaxID=2490854 RepID=A0A3S0R9X6_9BACT|nr:YqaA family protein [Prevotella koreensis]RUL58915.1 DedA family protein [Prevotella koreensis]
MDSITDILIGYGYWGMLLSAFLAGSVFPFSSEAVILALLAAGLDPLPLIIYGSIGNVAGSMFNYSVGRMGKTEWFERYLHISNKNMNRAKRFMGDRGAIMGFFAFIPIIGSAITVLLGLMRSNIFLSIASITIGKVLRYVLLVYGADLFM